MTAAEPRAPRTWIVLALAAAVCAAYARVGGFELVDLDDSAYVHGNEAVRAGLSLEGVGWAFTATHSANWHPLTWLSHMLDVSLFGLDPAGHHWTSVLLHAASTALCFLALEALTGARLRSALVAALFGLHPLHVESVAWVAERKDVLCGLLWMLTLLAWARFARAPSLERKLVALACFALALLAKPMAVTLPAVLLLLDVWPLGRWSPLGPGAGARLRPLIAEKAPFFVLAFLSSYVTWAVQHAAAATGSLATFPFGERVTNAITAYGIYLAELAWPASLGVFHPHPSTLGEGVEPAPLAVAAVTIAAASALAWRARTRRPYLLVGWLWFLGTLVPVIGLVQVGSQAHADRYTYLPSIGAFVALVWRVAEALERRRELAPTAGALGAGVLIALGVTTWRQTGHWRNAVALYERAIAVDERAWLAWNNLGRQHLDRGELARAESCLREALRWFPGYAEAHYNLGNVLLQRLEREQAIAEYRRALELDDANVDAWNNLGVALLNLGRHAEAVASFEQALARAPHHADSLENLALAFALAGERERAADACRRLAEVDAARAAQARAELGLGR